MISALQRLEDHLRPLAGDIPASGLDGVTCHTLGTVHFDRRDFERAAAYYAASLMSLGPAVDLIGLLTALGRSLGHLRRHDLGLEALKLAYDLAPDDANVRFYLGRAYQNCGIADLAFLHFVTLVTLKPDDHRALLGLAQVAHGLTFDGYGHFVGGAKDYARIALHAYQRLAELRPKSRDGAEGLTRLLVQTGDRTGAEAVLARFLKTDAPDHEKAGLLRTHVNACLDAGLYADAAASAQKLEKLEADRVFLDRVRRLCENLPPDSAVAGAVSIATYAPLGSFRLALRRRAVVTRRDLQRDPAGATSYDYLFFPRSAWLAPPHAAVQHGRKGSDTAGVRVIDGGREAGFLVDSAIVQADRASFTELPIETIAARHRWFHYQIRANVAPPPRSTARGRTLVLLTRNGHRLVGGGERFVADAARLYAAAGFRPVIVGFDPAGSGEIARDGSVEYAFLPEDIEALRSFLTAHDVGAIHTISGLGRMVLQATRALDILRIYGIHFWRELVLSAVGHEYYFPPETFLAQRMRADPGFVEILRGFDLLYANSEHTRDLTEALFATSLPVIPSTAEDDFGQVQEEAEEEEEEDEQDGADDPLTLPDAYGAFPPPAGLPSGAAEARPGGPDPDPLGLGEGFVLLVNARPDKGLETVLHCARALPHIAFVAIASQNSPAQAAYFADRAGLDNLTVLDRVVDIAEIYRRAALVVVPSFRFSETFGRVPVESARIGRPCLIARQGNLPGLAMSAEEVLDDDPEAWAARIDRFFTDPDFRTLLEDSARRRNLAWSQARQIEGIQRLARAIDAPRILLCCGAGVGNVCHVTPLVTHLSRHYGTPIDCFVAGDFRGTGPLLAGNPAVGAVFEDVAHCDARPYDIVIHSHSFGAAEIRFNAPFVVRPRDIAGFDPGGEEHEAVFVTRTVCEILGIPMPLDLASGYFVSDRRWDPPGTGRIGVHAGSKGGKWATKRWPHFERLAALLDARGFEVVSLGVPEEYVEGTVDETGGTIREMADIIAGCDLIISNDSGVMNVANAIGVPVVAFFAPTNPKTRGPINSRTLILAPDVDCRPCESTPEARWRFDQGRCNCLSLVSADEALDRILAFWNGLEDEAVDDVPAEPVRAAG